MTIPHQLEAAHVGQEVTVECQTEAYPKRYVQSCLKTLCYTINIFITKLSSSSINYWTDEKGNMLVSGATYFQKNLRFNPFLLILTTAYALRSKHQT